MTSRAGPGLDFYRIRKRQSVTRQPDRFKLGRPGEVGLNGPGPDSLTSLQKLQNIQRRDWLEWLYGHPEHVLLESLVSLLNERARKQVLTLLVKVPAHKGRPLNERADAAVSRAAMET